LAQILFQCFRPIGWLGHGNAISGTSELDHGCEDGPSSPRNFGQNIEDEKT
jgi:hypothetical protein